MEERGEDMDAALGDMVGMEDTGEVSEERRVGMVGMEDMDEDLEERRVDMAVTEDTVEDLEERREAALDGDMLKLRMNQLQAFSILRSKIQFLVAF
jgi:hypothetical protein